MRISDWSSDVCSSDLKKIPIAVNDAPLRITGTVGSSLYKSARAAGVPARLVAEYIKALSFGIDFQRDVGANAKFDIIFEHRLAETGETETGKQIGRATCRERGWQYVEISVVAGSLKKKRTKESKNT